MTKKHQSTQIAQFLNWLAVKLVAVSIVVVRLTASAQAGSSVFLTPVADLGALPFSSDSGLSSPPAINDWVSYILGVSTDDGSKIQAVDVRLKGPFGQHWNWDADASSFASTPSSLSLTGGDSHLLLPGNALTAVSPTEDNGSLLSSGSLGYGTGTAMHAAWGLPGPENAVSSMNLAYLVMPRGAESQLEYAIDGADGGGNLLFQFRQGASFPPPPPPTPLPPPVVEPPAGTSTPPLVIPPPATPEVPVNPPVVTKPPSGTTDPSTTISEPSIADLPLWTGTKDPPQVIEVVPPVGEVVPMPAGSWTTFFFVVDNTIPRYYSYDHLTLTASNRAVDTIYADGAVTLAPTYLRQNIGVVTALNGLAQTGFMSFANAAFPPVAEAGADPTPAPEPASLLLAGMALLGLVGLIRRPG